MAGLANTATLQHVGANLDHVSWVGPATIRIESSEGTREWPAVLVNVAHDPEPFYAVGVYETATLQASAATIRETGTHAWGQDSNPLVEWEKVVAPLERGSYVMLRRETP